MENPVVTYAMPGKYDVTLKVTDEFGKTDTKVMPAFIEAREFIKADFMASAKAAAVGEPVSFTNRSVAAVNYTWTFDNGEPAVSTETNPTVSFKVKGAAMVTLVAEDADGIAMLPQPFVTTAQTKKETLRTALDLTEEWNKIQESEGTASTLVTGVTVVRTAFAKEHPEAVADFMEAYQASVSYVTENTDEAAKLIGDYDIVPEAVAKKALPACNIVCITGDEMKEKLSGYLGVLKDQNPEAVGGELPGDDFYYSE